MIITLSYKDGQGMGANSTSIDNVRKLQLEAGSWHIHITDVLGVGKYRLPAATLQDITGSSTASAKDADDIWKHLENRCGDPIFVEFIGIIRGPSHFHPPAGNAKPGLDMGQ